MRVKKCLVCGKVFASSSYQKITCSEECRKIRKKTVQAKYYQKTFVRGRNEAKVCKYCGKEFTTCNNNHVYCTPECREAYYKQPLGRRTFECAFCGNSFEADARRKYCSAECRRNAEVSTKKRSKRKKPKLTLSQAAKLSREEGLTYGKYFEKYGYGDM